MLVFIIFFDCVQSKVTAIVKDSTDDLWFLHTDTDGAVYSSDNGDDKVYINELDVVSTVGNHDDASDSDSDINMKQDVSLVSLFSS